MNQPLFSFSTTFATRLQIILRTFAATMNNRLSILFTWMATCMMLLSTVVMHHHHYERVCVAFELCQHAADSDIEAEPEESHSHQESDRGSCRVHQLHKFIINASVAKNIRHHIADGNHFVAAIMPDARLLCTPASLTAADWQHTASTLRLRTLTALKRRGPPIL